MARFRGERETSTGFSRFKVPARAQNSFDAWNHWNVNARPIILIIVLRRNYRVVMGKRLSLSISYVDLERFINIFFFFFKERERKEKKRHRGFDRRFVKHPSFQSIIISRYTFDPIEFPIRRKKKGWRCKHQSTTLDLCFF